MHIDEIPSHLLVYIYWLCIVGNIWIGDDDGWNVFSMLCLLKKATKKEKNLPYMLQKMQNKNEYKNI